MCDLLAHIIIHPAPCRHRTLKELGWFLRGRRWTGTTRFSSTPVKADADREFLRANQKSISVNEAAVGRVLIVRVLKPVHRSPPDRPGVSIARGVSVISTNPARQKWIATLVFTILAVGTARAQPAEQEPLRLNGLVPTGARNSVTESWGTLRVDLSNPD